MEGEKLRLWRLFIGGRTVVTGVFLLTLGVMHGLVPPASFRPLILLTGVQFAANGVYVYLWQRRDLEFLTGLCFVLEIILITLFFSADNPFASGLLLVAFVLIAVLAAVFAIRGVSSNWTAIERTLETSSQLPVRMAVVLVFLLAALATDLGLDLLLGGFVAGIITRMALSGHEVRILESKLKAVGYGFLIPFFFVVSGIEFKLDALLDDPGELFKVPVFLAAFLIVRGVPAMLLYVREIGRAHV